MENVAILLSYTGETHETIGDAKLCRYGGTKTISIISFGQFASSAGFSYILDFFYSGIFEKDYLANYEYMLEHTGRLSMVQINKKMSDI
ncbi:hypothetical protein [Trichococcus sp.]|jgi:hypothetical protein|uniref:hypothetical protein n=1 Tax=Trichococcus sp. TaxID=1985464 RepID=UPI003C7C4377